MIYNILRNLSDEALIAVWKLGFLKRNGSLLWSDFDDILLTSDDDLIKTFLAKTTLQCIIGKHVDCADVYILQLTKYCSRSAKKMIVADILRARVRESHAKIS